MSSSLRRCVANLMVGTICLAVAALLLTDQPGLVLEYFANSIEPQSKPVFSEVSLPRLQGGQSLGRVLVSRQIFCLRWRGWLRVDRTGEHRFLVRSNQTATVRIDGAFVVGVKDRKGHPRSQSVWLDAGLHPIEIVFSQRRGRSRLTLEWAAAGEDFRPLGERALIARRPVGIRATLLRHASIPRLWVQGVGVLIALGGLIPLLRVAHSRQDLGKRLLRRWIGSGTQQIERRVAGVFLLGLFLFTMWAVFPYTTATAGGDDVRYMDAAMFNKKMGWNMNRYVHIYLLKGFLWSSGGDIFLASRIQWCFLFGSTVVALAIAIRTLGPGLQLKTLAVALFLLLAQRDLFGGIGAAYADYSAMMFVAVGIALYAHGFGFRSPRAGSGWHAMALGAVTVAAIKSKETGLILLWPALLLVWNEGRVDLRRFRRRMVFWLGGASLAYLLLMTLDAVVLGDFWFSLRPETFAGTERLRAATEQGWDLSRWAWLGVVWGSGPLRGLGLLATLSALAAFIRRDRPEIRLLTLTPLVYMVMMIAIHPPVDSSRYLFPAIPVACLFGATLVHHLGSSAESWRGPVAIRTVLIAASLMVLFGSGFEQNRQYLSRHIAHQRGELILYPWRQFREPIEAERPRTIQVSNRLYAEYQMIGNRVTRERIARMFFHRRHLRLKRAVNLEAKGQVAIGDRRDVAGWRETRPDAERRVEWDASGQIGIVWMD